MPQESLPSYSNPAGLKMKRILTLIFTILVLLIGCASPGAEREMETRSFLMGFTPWPYDATLEAVDWTYERINLNGDIVSHHMEEGVPWPEAAAGSAFAQEFRDEITSRTARYVDSKKVLLSISPLNMGRDGMALYRGASGSMALPSPWDGYALNSAEVKTAFLNYAVSMVESFQPDYLVLGVEVNLLIRNNPALWDAYLDLHEATYAALKTAYPDLPVGVSVFCVPFFPEWSPSDNLASQIAGLRQLETSADFIAFSLHPFMSGLTAESFPSDYLSRLYALTDKPVAVSESSYPAQYWQTMNAPLIDFNGTPAKQEAFLRSMLSASDTAGALFVIWFSLRDFDALWEGALGSDPTALVWRDTGLYGEDGDARAALSLWQEWFKRN